MSEVYFVQSEEGGPVKIGYTSDHITKRLAQLQTGNPVRLVSVGRITHPSEKALQETEIKLHVFLDKYGLKKQWFSKKEWFSEEVLTLKVKSSIEEFVRVYIDHYYYNPYEGRLLDKGITKIEWFEDGIAMTLKLNKDWNYRAKILGLNIIDENKYLPK